MSEALNLIHDTLDVFSGKKQSIKTPGLVDLMDTARNRKKKIEIDNSYTPEESCYSGNGKFISGEALNSLAEYFGSYQCMDYVRKAFIEILDSLQMPENDRAYYKWVMRAEE